MDAINKELENACLFTLAKDAEPALLQGITHWPEVCNFLLSRKVGGLFYKRLKAAGLSHLAPEPDLEKARQFFYYAALKNKVLFGELEKVWPVFSGKDVSLVLLKGSSLIARGICSPGERYQADLDFLIAGMERPELKALLARSGYDWMEHSDPHWWSEEHFVHSGSKGIDDVFSVFLEFHYTFRPLNRGSGDDLAKAIFKSSQAIEYKGRTYRIPSPEMQFYQAAVHGSAYHPFDSGYFWVSLADQAAILSSVRLDCPGMVEFAESQGMLEHLGLMSWVLANKLGCGKDLWEAVILKNPAMKGVLEATGQSLWRGLLNPNPVSFNNLVYILSRSSFKTRLHSFLELTRLAKGEHFQVQGKRFNPPRQGFFPLFFSRLKRFDKEYARLVWQMAKFYRKAKYRIPDDS
jgi:hypothetical protein